MNEVCYSRNFFPVLACRGPLNIFYEGMLAFNYLSVGGDSRDYGLILHLGGVN